MRLFGKPKRELPPLITDEELFPSVNYDSVMDWLVGLSDTEYAKVLQVANINRVREEPNLTRKAREGPGDERGPPNEPLIFIDKQKPPPQTAPPLLIDKEPQFLTGDEKPNKTKKIKVNH